MKMQMIADFKLYRKLKETGFFKQITQDDLDTICPGGFTFVVEGKSVPFDFDAQSTSEDEGVFHYESGCGPFFNDFEIPEGCWDEAYEEMGLKREDISPKFLASTSRIEEFFINLVPKGENEDVDVYQDPDSEFVVELIAISLEERDTGNSYDVDEIVISEFNENSIPDYSNMRIIDGRNQEVTK